MPLPAEPRPTSVVPTPRPALHDGTTPRVSVIIPAYNAAATIYDTIASVLAQTFTDFEVIVVDDGSTDRTAELAVSTGDPRIRLIGTENGGVSRARNRGISEARGELIAFLDADDIWLPRKLSCQVRVLEAKPEVGLCVTRATRIDTTSRPIGEVRTVHDSDDFTATLLLESSSVGMISSALVRRSALNSVGGFQPGQRQCEDWDMWLRLSLVTGISMLPEHLLWRRIHPGNASGHAAALERDTFPTLDRFFALADARPYLHMRRRTYATHWMVCSGSYLHEGLVVDALRCLARGVLYDPSTLRRPAGAPQRWIHRLSARIHGRVRTPPPPSDAGETQGGLR